MKKIVIFALLTVVLITLSACSPAAVTCGEGTIIKDGKCVAPNVEEDPVDNTDVSCDSISGELFYQADFNSLQSSFVDNEAGNEHNQNNFVIWGKADTQQLVDNASVEDGALFVEGLMGNQSKQYYDTGLGYQYFDFETDVTYTVCAIIEGPSGQSVTSELGIYYGHGTRDQVELTGEPQLVIQDFKPSLTTNTDRGQYVIFTGNVSGDFKVHSIKIVKND